MEQSFDWKAQAQAYFDACNAADADAIAGCFSPNAVHYFPAGIPGAPVTGSEAIAARLMDAISRVGSVWTVDAVAVDRDQPLVVVEWTNFRTLTQGYLRGDEWILFDAATGLIDEIRPYYAAPADPAAETSELGGFDYRERGYPLAPPFDRPRG